MIKFRINKLLVVSSALFFLSAFGGTALAMEYGGLGARPAFPDESNPRTAYIFVYPHILPNEIKDDGVLVVNNTADVKTILVYAVDSTPSTDGGFACKQISESKNDVGAWITLDKYEVTVEPGKNVMVPFKVRVPANAAAGEHDGCIITQEKLDTTSGKSGVSLSFRTGLRVVATIPGEITRKLQVTGFDVIHKDDGSFSMQLKVRNPGNVSIDTDIHVNTRLLGFISLPSFGGPYSILREDAADYSFDLAKPFWGGWYRASYSVKYDESQLAIVGVNSSSTPVVLTGSAIWFYSQPTNTALMIEITALLFVLFGIFLFILSIRRKKWVAESWLEYEVGVDETITSLADKFNVSWTLLAKANHLKAPYELKHGDKIKVPPEK